MTVLKISMFTKYMYINCKKNTYSIADFILEFYKNKNQISYGQ